MIKVTYTELDGPSGPTLRLEAAGHAGYAPAGQDIVCAGASTLMQTLVYLPRGSPGWRERLNLPRQVLPCWQSATRTTCALRT